MSSVKSSYQTGVLVLVFSVVFNFAGAASRQGLLKTPELRIQPVSRAEYDALLRLTKDASHSSEGRLIPGGLAAIRGLAMDLTSGIFPNLFPQLVNRNNDAASDKVSNNIADSEEEEEEEEPLCVIATEEATIEGDDDDDDDGADGGGRSKRLDAPIVNCVVLVKNREGEDTPKHPSHNRARDELAAQYPSGNVPWYPPYAAAAMPYNMPWFDAGAVPYYPSPYPPFAYPPVMPIAHTYNSPPKKHSSKLKAKRKRRYPRTVQMLPTSPSPSPSLMSTPPTPPLQQLAHKFATDAAKPVEEHTVAEQRHEERKGQLEDDQLQQSDGDGGDGGDGGDDDDDNDDEVGDSTELDAIHAAPESEAVQTNEVSHVAYQPVLYPQYGYQSNYPKVAYAHALPYPAPVYVPPTVATITAKPPTTTTTY